MAILPPRPYRLATQFGVRRVVGSLALAVLGLACLGGGLYWQGGELREIGADAALFQSGQLAEGVSVRGRETSHHFILNSYELDVDYADGRGAPHHGKAKFDLLFSSVQNNSQVSLRFDPADPERFAVSWAVEHQGARYASSIFMLLVFCGLFGFGALFVARTTLRQLGDVRQIAERSDELVLPIVEMRKVIVNGKHTGTELTVRHRVSPGAPETDYKQQIAAKETPLFADPEGKSVVALVSAHCPGRPWIVRESLYPFALAPEAIAEIRAKTSAPS